MNDKLKVTSKTPRAVQSREKTTRRKPWAPPSSLDAPPAPAGFKHRWIRAETLGLEDNKNLSARLALTDKKYFISIQTEVIDGRIFLSGKVDEPEEKIRITKMAWETNGARSVKNAITIKGQSNFKSTAKDILITSQLRTALIFNKNTKARNYTLETVNKKIYIFGISMDAKEKKEVINEANKIYDVKEVIPSIYLATELSRTKL